MDEPKWQSTSHLRGIAEEDHYERQRKVFHIPLYVRPARESSIASRQVEFRDFFGKTVARCVEDLTPDDCRLFCWKDCAIYGNGALDGSDHIVLLDKVYREWFPPRDRAEDLSAGSFFAKFMHFVPEEASLQDILDFHCVLCERLVALEKPNTVDGAYQSSCCSHTSSTTERQILAASHLLTSVYRLGS